MDGWIIYCEWYFNVRFVCECCVDRYVNHIRFYLDLDVLATNVNNGQNYIVIIRFNLKWFSCQQFRRHHRQTLQGTLCMPTTQSSRKSASPNQCLSGLCSQIPASMMKQTWAKQDWIKPCDPLTVPRVVINQRVLRKGRVQKREGSGEHPTHEPTTSPAPKNCQRSTLKIISNETAGCPIVLYPPPWLSFPICALRTISPLQRRPFH